MTISLSKTTKTLDFDWVLEISNIVIHIDSSLWGTKEDGSAIWRPLNEFESYLKLLTPKSCSFDRTDNDRTVLVDDSNFLTTWCPSHIRDHTLVTVVDHLLEPVGFVKHPNDDQTLSIRGGKLLVLVIPLDYDNVSLMTLEVLVHGEISTSLTFSGFKLEDFQKSLVSSGSQVTLLLVPPNHVKKGVIRHTNL